MFFNRWWSHMVPEHALPSKHELHKLVVLQIQKKNTLKWSKIIPRTDSMRWGRARNHLHLLQLCQSTPTGYWLGVIFLVLRSHVWFYILLPWVLAAILDVYHFVHPKVILYTSTFLILSALLTDDTMISQHIVWIISQHWF